MKFRRHSKSAFSLVEVTLALGVAGFCLTAIFGLLPVGVNTNKAAIAQTSAMNLLTSVVSDLRSTLPVSSRSPRFSISTTTSTPTVVYLSEDGSAVTSQADARYRLQCVLTPPSSGDRSATTGNVLISWPAQQDDISKAEGSVETFVALDRN